MMMYVTALIGFVLLIKGADYFVDGSASLASLMKIPPLLIGLTIVAMGTSAPEAAVSITASFAGNNDIALGNVVGSNIFNLLVVLGACAAIRPIAVESSFNKRDIPLSAIVSLALIFFALNGVVSRVEGLLLLVMMAGFMAMLIANGLKARNADDNVTVISMSRGKSLLWILGGLAAVIFGGHLVVESSILIAEAWGMSQRLIGLTVVAAGTSLPELVTSIVAARKGNSDLAVGNVIGSNLFNILFILGASSMISPVHSSAGSMVDMVVCLGASVMIMIFCRTGKTMSRWEGFTSLAAYGGYLTYLLVR